MSQRQAVRKCEEVPFVFTEENIAKSAEILAKYPDDWAVSGLMPLLDLAQRQNGGWLSPEALKYVAGFLKIPEIRAWEVASFYTMYHLTPVGKHVVNVCTTTPCWLRGSDKIMRACQKWLGVKTGETTQDKMFTLLEVECLGACANAPLVQVNDDYYEDLNEASVASVLEAIADGSPIKGGSQTGRKSSEPFEIKMNADTEKNGKK